METLTRIEGVLQELVAAVGTLQKKLEMPTQEWFSIKQASAYTGLSDDHIRRAVTSAMLPCSNVGSNDRPTYRISRKDLEEWLEKRKSGAIPSPRRKGREVPLPKSRFYS
jgi:excisionase family DNA binding protein